MNTLQHWLAHSWDPSSYPVRGYARNAVPVDVFEELYGDILDSEFRWDHMVDVDPYEGLLEPDRAERLRDEALRQRLIWIEATGTTQHPSWRVWPVVLEQESFPHISAELKRIKRSKEKAYEGVEAEFAGGKHPDEQARQASAFEIAWLTPEVGRSESWDITDWTVDLRYGDDRLVLDLMRVRPNSSAAQSKLTEMLSRGGLVTDAGQLSSEFLARVERISNWASARYRLILRDAPQLELKYRPLDQWLSGEPVFWVFGDDELGLEAMSKAQRQWADWAITTALHEVEHDRVRDHPPTLMLLDEPEEALHRTAESHMATALSGYSIEPGRHVIVATHSVDLIDAPNAEVVFVKDGLTRLSRIDREALEALGLHASDLLRRQRAFLLVEGEHDKAVLGEWIGEALEQYRIEPLLIRGARQLPATLDSQLLFGYFDAHVMVLLDRITHPRLTGIWADVQQMSRTRGPEAAAFELRKRLDPARIGTSTELHLLGDWLSEALARV